MISEPIRDWMIGIYDLKSRIAFKLFKQSGGDLKVSLNVKTDYTCVTGQLCNEGLYQILIFNFKLNVDDLQETAPQEGRDMIFFYQG